MSVVWLLTEADFQATHLQADALAVIKSRQFVDLKELYRVNTVVDINNLVSLNTLDSAGTFDFDRLQSPIVFRIEQPGESYSGIGRGEIKIEGLPVFADQLGPFDSTTSDSERTMVRLETTRILMIVIWFEGRITHPDMEGNRARPTGSLAMRSGQVVPCRSF